MKPFSSALLALALTVSTARAADWPTYRHDKARSGVTDEPLETPLVPCWVYRPAHEPQPAWGEPNPRPVGGWFGLTERPRVHFDTAFHPVVAGDTLYFGSSADGKVYALDMGTGQVRWSFPTLGPVRLAPTVAGERVYVGSDDGFVYCLRAADGGEVWRFRAAPGDRKVLGSGKMISLWPVRTGVLVDGGVAYFGAGIFPAEGVYLYAVSAADGKLLWCNDRGGAAPQSRLSPQGYLLASAERLFTPLGRVPPAAFDRESGRLLYEAYFGHRIGGTFAALAGGRVFTGTEEMIAYDQRSRSKSAWLDAHRLVVADDTLYTVNGRQIAAFDRATYPKRSVRRQALLDKRARASGPLRSARRTERRRQAAVNDDAKRLEALDKQMAEAKGPQLAELKAQRKAVATKLARDRKALDDAKKATAKHQKAMDKINADIQAIDETIAEARRWRLETSCDAAVIAAGGLVFAGGDGQVIAVDGATGEQRWSAKVEGSADGLAAAAGRLFVSTDAGALYCFGPQGSAQRGVVEQPVEAQPFPRDARTPLFEAAAEHIVRTTGVRRGYCLVLGAGTGRLIHALARRTELQFVGVCLDPKRLAATRKALDAAGLYGSRVILQRAEPSRVPFSEFFANLVVSEGPLLFNKMPWAMGEAERMAKPLGGTLCLG
ncbi:MAG: PQQ-binding-like beta-propeller repeat protein, partial [Planctomycetota bacterium]